MLPLRGSLPVYPINWTLLRPGETQKDKTVILWLQMYEDPVSYRGQWLMYLPTSRSTVGKHIGHYLGQASVKYRLSLKQDSTGSRPLWSTGRQWVNSRSLLCQRITNRSPTYQVTLGAKICEAFLCFLAIIFLGSIVFTSQWLLCITVECR